MSTHSKIEEKKRAASLVGYKMFGFDIKEPEVTGRKISGYFAVFNNKDSDGDIIIRGAFAKSISERGPQAQGGNKIAFLYQHDMKEPLGKITELKEDDYGLYFECELDDIPISNRVLTQLKSGTLNNFSIGFCYEWDKMEYDEDKDAFICKELRLYEGSVVTLAANDMTYFAGMKSEQRADELTLIRQEIDEALSGIKPRKQYELRQLTTKLIALATTKPQTDEKEALKGKKEPLKPKSKFSKLAQIAG